MIWKTAMPIKVACFGCLVTYEAIRVGYYVQHIISVEHYVHIYFYIAFTWQIYSMFLVAFGIEWVIPGKFRILECGKQLIEETLEINLYMHIMDYLERKEQKDFQRHYGAKTNSNCLYHLYFWKDGILSLIYMI